MKFPNSQSLCEELPYWDFVCDPIPHVVLKDGSLVAGRGVSLLDVECLDNQGINDLAVSLRSGLNAIQEDSTVQFFFNVRSDFSECIAKHSKGRSDKIHPLIAEISDERERTLSRAVETRELYRPHLYIFVRCRPKKAKRRGFFGTEREFSEQSIQAYDETLTLLVENIESLEQSLESIGMVSEPLAGTDQIALIYAFLNPKRSGGERAPEIHGPQNQSAPSDLRAPLWIRDQSPREQLVFGDLLLGFNDFVLDSYTHRVISLKTLPENSVAGQMGGLLCLPFHYDLLLSVEVPNQTDEMDRLKSKRRMAHSMASGHGGGVSDLESETKLNSTESLIRELLTTGQRIYQTQMQIVLRAPIGEKGEKELSGQVREVLAQIRRLQGAEGLEESVGSWKVLKGTLPLAPLNFERGRKMKTNNLADFLPVYGPSEGDLEPVVIFRNRLNGLVGFDAFDSGLPNYNTLVTGASGSGKSFLNNCILLQEMARDQRVFIIDVGGSYKKLTEGLGGQYFEINRTSIQRINPFHVARLKDGLPDHKLRSLLACLECMVSENESAKLSKLDRGLLEKNLIELYKAWTPQDSSPTLSDLEARLSKCAEPSMKDIAKLLYSWTGDRPYGKVFDGQGSFKVDSAICTFDLKGLSSDPDLQRVMILILTDFILGEIESDKVTRKRIILDEAWELLKSNAAANFMEYCARTLRKTGSGITFITQGVEEIEASPIGAAILNNTATKFVMLQRGDVDVLKRVLKLNEREVELIHSLHQKKGLFAEGFMIKEDRRQIIRVFPTALEYWLSTSDAKDNAFLNSLIASGLTPEESIRKAAKEFPGGVGQAPREAA